mmetsp:Transcript_35443/g.42316  ORF Transcript_35443/g.42316 Transcript_35443/m.42316 type:complete len:114 (-) Transcript_35443:713-1054(-)
MRSGTPRPTETFHKSPLFAASLVSDECGEEVKASSSGVGRKVRAEESEAVGRKVRAVGGDRVGDSVGDRVGDSAGSSVGDSVGKEVGGSKIQTYASSPPSNARAFPFGWKDKS